MPARRPLSRLIACLCAIASVLAPNAALAAKVAVVSRAVGPGSDKAAALVGYYLRQQLTAEGTDEVVDLTQVLGNLERDKVLRRFSLAEGLFQKAREAFATLELDAADEALRGCIARYERHAGYVRDYKKVAEALMLLGAVRVLRGDERSGASLFEQAITVYPQIEPDPRIFNPAMRLQFSQTAERLGSRAKGTLSLSSSPGAAPVFVDGKFVGVTPVVVENVLEGRHYVRVEREGYRPWGKVMNVAAGSETDDNALLGPALHYDELEATTDKAVRALSADADQARAPTAQAVIDLVQADALLLTAVRLDGERVRVTAEKVANHERRPIKPSEHVFAYESRIETYEREVAVMLHNADLAPAASAVTSANAGPGAGTGAGGTAGVRTGGAKGSRRGRDELDKQLVATPTTPGRRSLTAKRVVAGGLTGLGGVSVVVGAVEYILAKRTHDAWARTPQSRLDASGKHLQQDVLSARGRNQALAGDILVGAGAVGVIAGILTWSLWHPDVTLDEVERPAPNRHAERAGLDLQLDVLPLAHGAMFAPSVHF